MDANLSAYALAFRAFRCVRGVPVYLRSTTTLEYLRKDAAARSARLSKPQGKASRLDELRQTRPRGHLWAGGQRLSSISACRPACNVARAV